MRWTWLWAARCTSSGYRSIRLGGMLASDLMVSWPRRMGCANLLSCRIPWCVFWDQPYSPEVVVSAAPDPVPIPSRLSAEWPWWFLHLRIENAQTDVWFACCPVLWSQWSHPWEVRCWKFFQRYGWTATWWFFYRFGILNGIAGGSLLNECIVDVTWLYVDDIVITWNLELYCVDSS